MGTTPAYCRSEPAREKPRNAAGHLVFHVIVHDLREQARSYRFLCAISAQIAAENGLVTIGRAFTHHQGVASGSKGFDGDRCALPEILV